MDHNSELFSATPVELNGTSVVQLRGELDLEAAPVMAAVLAALTEEDGPAEVVLDLSELTFLDSSGISVLITGQRNMNGQGRRFTVRSARPNIRKVLTISGLTEFLNASDGENAEAS
jgi:anti-sigma B factor antagonist